MSIGLQDDSDNEQLNSSGSESEEDLVLSSSEDEKEKSDRLARYSFSFYLSVYLPICLSVFLSSVEGRGGPRQRTRRRNQTD